MDKNRIICPTVLAEDPESFAKQISKIKLFAKRIQIDLVDGKFTDSKTITPSQVYLPDGILCDLHIMFANPYSELMTLISLHPNMVIIHAESMGDKINFLNELKKVQIKAGVALLPETSPKDAKELLEVADHCLIFAGSLGHFGGAADETQLTKISEIKEINPDIEIGWDGGINNSNVSRIAKAGVNVLNVGGFIQKSENPKQAYKTLEKIVKSI